MFQLRVFSPVDLHLCLAGLLFFDLFFFPYACLSVHFLLSRGIIFLWSLSRFKRFSVAFFLSPVHQLTFARELRRDVRGLNLFQLLLRQPLPGAVEPAWQEAAQPFLQPLQTYRCKAAGGKPSTLSPFLGLGGGLVFPWPHNMAKAEPPSIPVVEKIKYIKSTIALRLQKRPLKGAEKGTTNSLSIEGLL